MVEIQLKTHEDVHGYVRALSGRRVEDDPAVKAWNMAKQTTYLYTLVVCFLVYFLIAVVNQSMSLPAVTLNLAVVVNPAPGGEGSQLQAPQSGPKRPSFMTR